MPPKDNSFLYFKIIKGAIYFAQFPSLSVASRYAIKLKYSVRRNFPSWAKLIPKGLPSEQLHPDIIVALPAVYQPCAGRQVKATYNFKA